LLYVESRYVNVTEKEFEQSIVYNKNRAKELLINWQIHKDVLDVAKLNGYYLSVTLGQKYFDKEIIESIEFDETLLNLEHYNFAVNHTYSIKANLIAELSKNFQPVTIVKPWAEKLTEVENEKLNGMTFKEKVISYIELKNSEFSYMPDFDKVVIDAVNLLGIEKIKNLNYHKGDIEKALIAKSDVSESNKIMKLLLMNGIKPGDVKSIDELRALFNYIYDHLNIKKAGASTHIKKYFDALYMDTTINNERFKGYRIIRPLTIFN
jgi:hypothetical protein